MINSIDPVSANLRLTQLLGEDLFAQAPTGSVSAGSIGTAPAAVAKVNFTGNPFEDVLSKAIESLEGVSKTETYANQMVDKYVKGEVELQEVMIAQAKMNVMVQMAVTTVNSAVTTFKEITQMQV